MQNDFYLENARPRESRCPLGLANPFSELAALFRVLLLSTLHVAALRARSTFHAATILHLATLFAALQFRSGIRLPFPTKSSTPSVQLSWSNFPGTQFASTLMHIGSGLAAHVRATRTFRDIGTSTPLVVAVNVAVRVDADARLVIPIGVMAMMSPVDVHLWLVVAQTKLEFQDTGTLRCVIGLPAPNLISST